jgi:hypothetical protein
MKRPSARFLVTVCLLVGVFIFVMLPFFASSRWVGGADLVFNVKVLDSQKQPIPNAQVTLSEAYAGPRSGMTDSAGRVRLQKTFIAYGSARWAYCQLDSTMRVEAGGYKPWEATLPSLFGVRYDYFKNGTNISYAVTLTRAEQAKPDGPANGSQPIRSETNRTSSAAGSRR